MTLRVARWHEMSGKHGSRWQRESIGTDAGRNMCASPAHAEQRELKPPVFLSGSVFSAIGSYGYLYFMESDGVIGYKERVLPLDGHASRRSQFAPVIVILTPFPFAAAFFFK